MPYAATLETAALPQIKDIVSAVKTVLGVKWWTQTHSSPSCKAYPNFILPQTFLGDSANTS